MSPEPDSKDASKAYSKGKLPLASINSHARRHVVKQLLSWLQQEPPRSIRTATEFKQWLEATIASQGNNFEEVGRPR